MSGMQEAYAQALWQCLVRGMDEKKAVLALKETLERHGRLSLLSNVARAFERLALRRVAADQISLVVARAGDEKAAKEAVRGILKDRGVDEEDVRVRVDEHLIGGWRLEGRERLVDASWKRSLTEMYQTIIS